MALDVLKDKVIGKGGKTAVEADVIGIYFSAHWCPPCKGFTPVLAGLYEKLKAGGESFEIVFVSSDRDEAAFKEYYAEMPWLALDFSERAAKDALSKLYGVSGIPTLVIIDKAGNTITQEGRGKVMEKMGQDKPSAKADDWK